MGPRTREIVDFYLASGEDRKATAEHFGISRDYMKKIINMHVVAPANGRVLYHNDIPEEIRRMQKRITRRPLPSRGKVKRYILTAAQNNVKVSPTLWKNIRALADHYDAEILVATITYAKTTFGALNAKRGSGSEREPVWWDECVVPYIDEGDQNIQLGKHLVWFGQLNILPTAVNPLSGFETLTGTRSTIIPHNRLAYLSVPQAKGGKHKAIMTTGVLTRHSFLERSAGHRAIPHHTIGCLIAEVDSRGNHWVRQVHAHHNDDLHDLTICASNGRIRKGIKAETIVWGDIHVPYTHPEFRKKAWGRGGLLDTLKPRHQMFHDLLDFRARNHHERNNPHSNYRKFMHGNESITEELEAASSFLRDTQRSWCRSVVVDSNHDNALTRYLREVDWRSDMPNAELNLEANLAIIQAIRNKRKNFHLVEWAMRKFKAPKDVRFLRVDEPYVVKNVEHGMHGHIGPNGVFGSAASLKRSGRKATIGHSHSPTILEGLWQVGTSSELDLGYNRGPSSWSLTCCVLYPNGKRSLLTFSDGRFYA